MVISIEATARGRAGSHRADKKITEQKSKSYPNIALGPNSRFLPRRALHM
jgi:hypothetical protein